MGNTYTGSNVGKAGLEMTEVDGAPDVFGVSKIIVSNGTLADDGNGTVTLTTGGGGGGGVTTIAFGTTGLTPALAASGIVAVAGTLIVSHGGTGATTLTDHGVLLGSGTAAITALGEAADGQLVIGSTGADPVLATVTNGAGIVITGGAGSLEVGVDEVLEDLDALGAPTADGEFIVATGAGSFTYETGDTALESLGIVHGRDAFALDGGGALTSMTVTNTAVTASNTILFSIEIDETQVIVNRPPALAQGGRSAGVSFTVICDFGGAPLASVFCNYMIIG